MCKYILRWLFSKEINTSRVDLVVIMVIAILVSDNKYKEAIICSIASGVIIAIIQAMCDFKRR